MVLLIVSAQPPCSPVPPERAAQVSNSGVKFESFTINLLIHLMSGHIYFLLTFVHNKVDTDVSLVEAVLLLQRGAYTYLYIYIFFLCSFPLLTAITQRRLIDPRRW